MRRSAGGLDKLARQRDVSARLLYAIWPPVMAFDLDAFENDIAWVNKAHAYSLDNLMDGEPTGLLAFGTSYAYGLFTRQKPALGESIIRAALRCITDEEELKHVLDHDLQRAIRITREGIRMDEDPVVVAFEKQLSELCH